MAGQGYLGVRAGWDRAADRYRVMKVAWQISADGTDKAATLRG